MSPARTTSLHRAAFAVATLSTLAATVTHANVFVSARAFAPRDNRIEEIAQFSDAPSAWARAFADSSGGSAVFGTGTHDPFLGGPDVANAFSPPGGAAAAGVDASLGLLRARATANSDGHSNLPPGSATGTNGRAEARILDAIAFQGTPVLDLHLDITRFTTGADSQSELTFSVIMPLTSAQKPFFPDGKKFLNVIKVSVVNSHGSGDHHRIEYGDPATPFHQVVQANGLPPDDFSVNLNSLNDPVFPIFGFHTLNVFEFSLHVDADGSSDDNGFSHIRADNTAHIAIPNGFTSASGYAYPALVPEPSSLLLLSLPALLLSRPRQKSKLYN